MTEDEVRDLVLKHISDEKEVEITIRAVMFVANKLELSRELCDKIFGQNIANVEEVYTMHDYLMRETSAQVLIMAGEKATAQLKASQARVKPEGELN